MVSIKATVMVLTFLTVCLMATDVTSVYHGCCTQYMRSKLPFKKVKGYTVQLVTENCPINAIIFHTMKGKTCADPALSWVMDYVNRLRNKAQMVHKTSQK